MCLSKLTWKAKSPSNPRCKDKWVVGYKVFEKKSNYNYHTQESGSDTYHFPYKDLHEVVLDKVLKAVNPFTKANKEITISGNNSYPPGFHIFTVPIAAKFYSTRPHGRNWTIFKVEYRKVIAQGEHTTMTNYTADCVVAKEMRIIGPYTEPIISAEEIVADYGKDK